MRYPLQLLLDAIASLHTGTGVFCETSWTFPCGVNEMEAAGLEAAPSLLIKPPRIKATPCALECKWLRTVRLDDVDGKPAPRFIAFGQVIGVHIDERFIKDGLLDTAAMKPILRAGYHDYFVATEGTRFGMPHFKSQRAGQHIEDTWD